MEDIIKIIESIDSGFPNVNPTQIYNEGWMTRLLVKESIKERIEFGGLDFGKISNWTSEALISSPFIKVPKYSERYTHADIALGDFMVDYKKSGKIEVSSDAKIFGIIEAKMGSNLAQRTKNADNYNQTSRTLACICEQTYDKPNSKIFFAVVGPEKKLLSYKIAEQIKLNYMIKQIEDRFDLSFDSSSPSERSLILSKAETCVVKVFSYENWIEVIEEAIKDEHSRKFLNEFYQKTKKWNRI